MIDHDLPASSHAAAVEDARVEALRHATQPHARGPRGVSMPVAQPQQGDGTAESAKQQGDTIFKDWASI